MRRAHYGKPAVKVKTPLPDESGSKGNNKEGGDEIGPNVVGQVWAVLRHSLEDKEVSQLKNSTTRVFLIHGKDDEVALPAHAQRSQSYFVYPRLILILKMRFNEAKFILIPVLH